MKSAVLGVLVLLALMAGVIFVLAHFREQKRKANDELLRRTRERAAEEARARAAVDRAQRNKTVWKEEPPYSPPPISTRSSRPAPKLQPPKPAPRRTSSSRRGSLSDDDITSTPYIDTTPYSPPSYGSYSSGYSSGSDSSSDSGSSSSGGSDSGGGGGGGE